MTDATGLKKQLAGETRARLAAEQRERETLVRAERAEHAERNLTRELDRAHREIEQLKITAKLADALLAR